MILSDFSRRSLLAMSLGSVLGTQATLAQEATPAGSDGDWPMPGANAGRTGAITAPGLTAAPIERWRIPVDLSQQPAPTGPLIAGDTMVLFQWGDQRLHAYDLATGMERWLADIGVVAGEDAELPGAIGDGVLYAWGTFGEASSSDSAAPPALYALDLATGQQIWRVDFPVDTITTTPIYLDARLVFTIQELDAPKVLVLDPASGKELWRTPFSPGVESTSGSVAGAEGLVFVPLWNYEASDNTLVALELAGGAEKWRASRADYVYTGSVIADGAVYISGLTEDSVSRVLKALDAETGTTRWEFMADDWIGVQAESVSILRIVVAHGLVYLDVEVPIFSGDVYTWKHSILALDQATGTEKWRLDGMATPVIAGDILYVITLPYEFNTYPVEMPTFPTFTGNPLFANSQDDPTDPDAQPSLVGLDAITGAELWRLAGDVRLMCAGPSLLLVESYEAVIAYGAPQ